jgi:glycosyltransferase involved in cell wall biosynthesis
VQSGIIICLVSSYPPIRAGESTYAQSYVNALLTYLDKEIDEIFVLSHVDGKKEQQENCQDGDKVKVYRLFNSRNFLSKNLSFLKIFRKIRKIRPDVVHFQYPPIPKSRFGGLLGEPLLPLFLLLKIIGIPFVVTLHSIWFPDEAEARAYELTKNRLLSKLAKHYFKILMYFFGRIPDKLFILVTNENTKIIQAFSHAYHIPPEKLRVELHGLRHFNKSAENSNPKSKKITCLGYIVPNKGYEFVLMAMKDVLKKIPDASLVIAGSTISQEGKEYFDKLRRMVSEYSIEGSVTIEERYLSETEFVEYVRNSGIVILPYLRVLGVSGIMSLAVSYKVPVIASSSGPLFDEISHIVPIVPPANNYRLADEIIKILKSDDYRSTIIKKYEEYLSTHDWSVVTRENYKEYINLINLKSLGKN